MTVDVDSDHFCIASDNNPIRVSMPYFGVVEQIWELDYNDFRVPVFKCMWVNGNIGVHVDHLGFTLVDLNRVTYMEEPFIMAEQARQVFYIEDTSDSRLSLVLQGRPSVICHQNHDPTFDICEIPAFSKKMPSVSEEPDVDDVHANHTDHHEGL